MTTQGKKSAERTARIIELARKDSTLTNSAIAQRLGIDASTVSATLKKAARAQSSEGVMKERPILFSAPMVRAVLDGRKTQTRRVVKLGDGWEVDAFSLDPSRTPPWRMGVYVEGNGADVGGIKCPYGVPGDRLWVRESIRRGEDENGGPIERVSSFFMADGARTKADAWPWQRNELPSIHCPRGLSRITLEVTGVRVERLHDIDGEGARAEGVERVTGRDVPAFMGGGIETWRNYEDPEAWVTSARGSFASLWRSINGPESWAANPWVWVVSFKRVMP